MAKTDWADGDKFTASAANQIGTEINAKAAKGDTGDRGPAGEQGPAGERGPAGAKGDTGERGPAGSAGDKGEKGDKGDTGAAGPTQFTDAEVTALKALIPEA